MLKCHCEKVAETKVLELTSLESSVIWSLLVFMLSFHHPVVVNGFFRNKTNSSYMPSLVVVWPLKHTEKYFEKVQN